MAKTYKKLDRRELRKLAPGDKVISDAIEADRQARGEPVKYVMSEDEVFESLYDVAVSHIDSNGISVIEPDILSSLVRVLAVAVTDEEGFFPQPQQQASEPVAWLRSDELRKLGHPYSDAPLNSKTDSMMLHAKGTQEAAAKYGHDVPVFIAPQPQRQASGWPKVNGVGRVIGSEQSLEVYFDSEPSDDQLRAVHNFLTSPQTQQIPEGYKLVPVEPEACEPVKVPSDAEDDIVDLLAEYADHNAEHGRMSFDKWTLREAVSALLAKYAK